MDERILIGAIVGVGTVSSIYIWKSENFSKAQKAILLVFILFLPLQWILAIVMYFYNKNRNSLTSFKQEKSIKNLDELEFLKSTGILSEKEFKEKTEEVKTNLETANLKETEEYKSLHKLNKSGVLSDEEFNNKVQLLLSNKINNSPKYKTTELYGNWLFEEGELKFYNEKEYNCDRIQISWKNKEVQYGYWEIVNDYLKITIYLILSSRTKILKIIELNADNLVFELDNIKYNAKRKNNE